MNLLNKFTLERPRTSQKRVRGEKRSWEDNEYRKDGHNLPIFTNPKTLTFAAITGIVSFSWSALRNLPQEFWDSQYIPLSFSLILGLFLGAINLSEIKKGESLSRIEYFLGFFMAILNSLIIFGAVIGASNFTE